MPRMIDQIRENKVPSNMMQFAARGALSVPPAENLEILVYLATRNKVYGDLAKMTLAGWDVQACKEAAANPLTPREVLDYLIAPDNLRPQLFPALLENKSVTDSVIAKMAVSANREQIDAMLASPRIQGSQVLLEALAPNPYLKPADATAIKSLLKKLNGETATGPAAPASSEANESSTESAENALTPEQEKSVAAYLETNAAEIASEGAKPFRVIGWGPEDSEASESISAGAGTAATAEPAVPVAAAPVVVAASCGAAAAPALAHVTPKPHEEKKRMNTVQRIASLDVKGRIQVALKGNKEERSLLIRDGTKVVALAVLEAPKLSDGEVEKFASQKNVLEAVLRQIPLKRRFMKNYIVIRNLVNNPRTPLDISLNLMKNLMIQDLKNLSSNKEVAETIRKLALRMFKQKTDDAKKK